MVCILNKLGISYGEHNKTVTQKNIKPHTQNTTVGDSQSLNITLGITGDSVYFKHILNSCFRIH